MQSLLTELKNNMLTFIVWVSPPLSVRFVKNELEAQQQTVNMGFELFKNWGIHNEKNYWETGWHLPPLVLPSLIDFEAVTFDR